jgi:hypothetical protein
MTSGFPQAAAASTWIEDGWMAEPELPPHVAAKVLRRRAPVNGIIYLVGLVVVVMFILSFLGLR